jgi:hypothetical protein
MRGASSVLCSIFLGLGILPLAFAQDKSEPQPDTLVCNKRYKVVSAEGDHEIGTYEIKAVSRGRDRKMEIAESLSLDYRGKKAEYKSTVIYGNTSPPVPENGAVETKVDGKTCMKGTVTFSEKTLSFECSGLLDKRTGEAIDPPKKFEKKDLPKPEGALIFQSALAVIGPRLLTKEGTLQKVVFVEFPDDLGAPELINFKKGYRLVRGKQDAQGEYHLEIYSALSEDSISKIRFDKNDQIVSISSFGNKMKLVEIKEK